MNGENYMDISIRVTKKFDYLFDLTYYLVDLYEFFYILERLEGEYKFSEKLTAYTSRSINYRFRKNIELLQFEEGSFLTKIRENFNTISQVVVTVAALKTFLPSDPNLKLNTANNQIIIENNLGNITIEVFIQDDDLKRDFDDFVNREDLESIEEDLINYDENGVAVIDKTRVRIRKSLLSEN